VEIGEDYEEIISIAERPDTGRGGRGMGDYFDIDPTFIRLIWVILGVLTAGTAIIAYIIAWILIPEEGSISQIE
jgi:phage shock protein PspC (stress-responsive transcriptional regulator)